jgi:hypothetical protein
MGCFSVYSTAGVLSIFELTFAFANHNTNNGNKSKKQNINPDDEVSLK